MPSYPWEAACAEAASGDETHFTAFSHKHWFDRVFIKDLMRSDRSGLEEKLKIKYALAQLTKLERERAD